jgi:hypothetical protein
MVASLAGQDPATTAGRRRLTQIDHRSRLVASVGVRRAAVVCSGEVGVVLGAVVVPRRCLQLRQRLISRGQWIGERPTGGLDLWRAGLLLGPLLLLLLLLGLWLLLGPRLRLLLLGLRMLLGPLLLLGLRLGLLLGRLGLLLGRLGLLPALQQGRAPGAAGAGGRLAGRQWAAVLHTPGRAPPDAGRAAAQ